MAAAAAKNIAKKFASYAHANPRLNRETSVTTVSSRTLASNLPSPLPTAHAIAADKGRNAGKHRYRCSAWKELNLRLHPEQVTLFP